MQDDVETVALSMVEVLGYDRKADWSRVYVGNGMEADGSLKALCYGLAAAALSAATPVIEARVTAAIVDWLEKQAAMSLNDGPYHRVIHAIFMGDHLPSAGDAGEG